jgi:TetR/AcrR family tetracycline transcriptional repressor
MIRSPHTPFSPAKENNMAFGNRLIASMERGGLRGTAALWGASTVFCYVLGEVLEPQSGSLPARDDLEVMDNDYYP